VNTTLAWFPVDRAGAIVMATDAVVAIWGGSPDRRHVMGGVGHVVTDESSIFVYVMDGCSDCLWDSGSDVS
jgi:hypothetical protein